MNHFIFRFCETRFFVFIETNSVFMLFVFMILGNSPVIQLTKGLKTIESGVRLPMSAKALDKILAVEGTGSIVQIRSRVITNSMCLSKSPKDHESEN